MSADLDQRARHLLAGDGDRTSADIADRAARACDRLATHISGLLGRTGVTLLVRRSISLATAQHAWLTPALVPDDPVAGLREAMSMQDAESITSAFGLVLSAFVGLLQRLIGEDLVERLLEEAWPTVFSDGAKDTV